MVVTIADPKNCLFVIVCLFLTAAELEWICEGAVTVFFGYARVL